MSQRSVLLAMLREAGPKGVSVHDLIYDRGITRAAAIVFDLKQAGHDIETVDGKRLGDGRQELARYVLRERRQPVVRRPQPGLFDDLPASASPIKFDCGCVRSADAKIWTVRCALHADAPKEAR
jgi:hypothetical protein